MLLNDKIEGQSMSEQHMIQMSRKGYDKGRQLMPVPWQVMLDNQGR